MKAVSVCSESGVIRGRRFQSVETWDQYLSKYDVNEGVISQVVHGRYINRLKPIYQYIEGDISIHRTYISHDSVYPELKMIYIRIED